MSFRQFAASVAGILGASVFLTFCAVFLAFSMFGPGFSIIHADTPLWIYGFVLFMFIVVPIVVAFFAANFLSVRMQSFSEHLLEAGADDKVHATRLSFVELRRLRVGIRRQVARLRRESDALRKAAYTDPRTGLPNTLALTDAIERGLTIANFEHPAAMIYLDIDGYGRALESLGEAHHGELMRQISARIGKLFDIVEGPSGAALRGATIASLQSDEFGVFLPQARCREDVASIARSLRTAFAAPFVVEGVPVQAGISGGIVMAPEDADTPDKMIRHAELALTLVRKESKTGFRFYTPRMNRLQRGRMKLENELREAVVNREFKAVFQPKIDFATGKIVGAEALARWSRPGGKTISPGAFIPVAEDIGLINQIGAQILESACVCAKEWMDAGHALSVAVNVSPRQFERNDLTQTVLRALSQSGLPPSRLELEITENIAVSDPDKVGRVMEPLRAMGVRLAIDDFGTGHSNLSILTQLPFDVFKIDRQFVSGLQTDRQAAPIIEMILAMADTLGMETVAEGIETAQQADFLSKRGCTIAQGFLYSPGLAQGDFLAFLKNWTVDSETPETWQVRDAG